MQLQIMIKNKFYFKYITLLLILFLLFPLAGIIITQFIKKNLFAISLIIFIIIFIIDMVMCQIYYKKFNLPEIESYEDLLSYMGYFSSGTISDLEYSESITWFSHVVKSAYLKPEEFKSSELNTNINNLYRILRLDEKNTCAALKRKSSFINICRKLLNNENICDDINSFFNMKVEKYSYISFIKDKYILTYLMIIAIHIFACFLITYGGNICFSFPIFFGNCLFYVPTDILAILIYKGIIKETNS